MCASGNKQNNSVPDCPGFFVLREYLSHRKIKIITPTEEYMYNKVNTSLNFVDREREILKFWNENKIFEMQLEQNKDCPGYTFYDGPPTANGKPHIGHVLTRVIKDMIPRYHWMKGADVPRKAGWDTHGLPVEIEVEKKLGLDGKEQIEQFGLEPFIKECKESVWKYKGMWEDFSGTVGFWADMNDPYVTYDNNFIESVVGSPPDLGQGPPLQGLQDRSLLPSLRYSPLRAGGCSGLQDRKGTLCSRSLQGKG